jgi:ribulose-5-phosphate 4-epimerase/fuculose-1-phosphate aldolase
VIEPPAFAAPPERSAEAERLHRKQRLAGAFRLFGRFGFSEGLAGHVTARDPELSDHFWVNPLGVNFSRIKVSDLLLIDAEGRVVEGARPVNTAAFAIHSRIHAARPDVVAAAHTHATHGRALSTLGEVLAPITQDACAFYQNQAIYDDYAGVVFSREEGSRIAAALGPHRLAILANHGLLTVGPTVEAACWWFVTAERSAQVQLLAAAAGKPRHIDPATAELTAKQVGDEGLGAAAFESLYEAILHEEPDLLD